MAKLEFTFRGQVYQVPPELWACLYLPRDHSWWAKRVRWTCGRPGFEA